MNFSEVTITQLDTCKTYALKRIGLGDIIDWSLDKPSFKDLITSKSFKIIGIAEPGCLIFWGKDIDKAYFVPRKITKAGQIVSLESYNFGHCGVLENDDLVSDCYSENGKSTIRIREFRKLPTPDYILKKI